MRAKPNASSEGGRALNGINGHGQVAELQRARMLKATVQEIVRMFATY